ncbi:uncharacterized protein FFNC_14839 [Fusarium fujikuroi]|nr:uncharacterized protein FFNC_14839 [Fusarium fujikuroi]
MSDNEDGTQARLYSQLSSNELAKIDRLDLRLNSSDPTHDLPY